MKSILLLLLAVLSTVRAQEVLDVPARSIPARPPSFKIRSVPFHRQVTSWSCGAGSHAMVMNYWGVDLDQRAIIDVLRTSDEEGKFAW